MRAIITLKNAILVLCCLAPSVLFAAGGKIAGRVTDKETGEPLPGVNVMIEGTTMGAATDLNGNYVILNVPAGTYSVRTSFIGYADYKVSNLRVSIGQTTRLNIAMTSKVIAGEEVTIVAERPMVQKDLTASQKTTSAEEIKALPVEDFTAVLATQAGVNRGADGALHIRGGRDNEIGFYIDGVPVTNPFFTNTLATNVSNKALDEMKVVSGAFNAEYGNAMSGIVNIQVKEGGPEFSGSISAYSGDYISDGTDIFMNIDDLDPAANYILEGTLNGPVPFTGDKITFNISSRYNDDEGYIYGLREHLPSDSANFLNNENWFIEMGGDSSYVPMNWSKDLNLLSKLTYKINPSIKLSTQLIYDRARYKYYGAAAHNYRYVPDGTAQSYKDNYNYSVKLTHVFGKSYYEANLFYSVTDFSNYVYEDSLDSRYVSTTKIRGTPSSSVFNFGGMQMGHTYRNSTSMGGKFDFTSQLNMHHEVKTGLHYRLDNLQERQFTILYDNLQYREPTVKAANETPSHIFYDKDAVSFSAYLQDKIEYGDMIVNAGVRYDYFDPKSEYIDNLILPDVSERKTAEPKQTVSPRLGIAFPITDRGVLHFSYGHFYQMPPLRRLYLEQVFGAGTTPQIGYANLKPEKTVIYEFGLQQQLAEVLSLEMTLFSKDIRDLLALQTIRYESPQFGPSTYSVFLNKDYGDVKGFTLSLIKRRDPATKLEAWVDYTFQHTSGNSVTGNAFFFSAISGIEEEKRIVPLNWDQTHLINATVSLSDPNNWGISFIGKIASGWPYTPEIPYANYIPDPNSERKPLQRNVDLYLYKNFSLKSINLVLFTKVFNLFDTRNERYVFDDTGRAGYTFWNRSAQETEALKSHYGEPGVHTWEEYMTRAHYYTAPRLVQAGLSIEF